MNEEIQIAQISQNCNVSVEQHAHMREQTKDRPLTPNTFVVDDDETAGSLIDRAGNHLSMMTDDDDGLGPDERLDKAIQCLQAAKRLRAGTVGGLGQHAVHFVR
jgi:hypothetical protein